MDRIDRVLLAAAYVLLVGTLVIGAWRTDRQLDRIQDDVCVGVSVSLAQTVTLLVTFGEQEGVNETALRDALDVTTGLLEIARTECGDRLDELELRLRVGG